MAFRPDGQNTIFRAWQYFRQQSAEHPLSL
jgi:hypothetical protein